MVFKKYRNDFFTGEYLVVLLTFLWRTDVYFSKKLALKASDSDNDSDIDSNGDFDEVTFDLLSDYDNSEA